MEWWKWSTPELINLFCDIIACNAHTHAHVTIYLPEANGKGHYLFFPYFENCYLLQSKIEKKDTVRYTFVRIENDKKMLSQFNVQIKYINITKSIEKFS